MNRKQMETALEIGGEHWVEVHSSVFAGIITNCEIQDVSICINSLGYVFVWGLDLMRGGGGPILSCIQEAKSIIKKEERLKIFQ